MLRFTMKIGPKGQVVIPAVLRKHLKLKPKSKVIITLKDNEIIITRPRYDVPELFKRIANAGNKKRIILLDPDIEYERNMKEIFL